MKKAIVMIIGLMLSSVLYATQTLHGPSGMILMPSGESLEYGKFDFGIDYQLNEGSGRDENRYYYKFNIGALKNSEIGIVGGSVPTEGVFVNVKYFLLSDNERFPLSIAVGIENLGSHSETGTYFVGTKKFEGGLAAHMGFKAVFSEKIDPSVMLGGEYIFDDRLTFLADFTGKNRQYGLNLGVQYYMSYDVVCRLNVIDVTQNINDETIVAMGVSFARFFL